MTRLRRHLAKCSDVLDVGSQDINGTYRPLFVGWDYVGLDISAGKNVDVAVADPYDWAELQGRTFDAVISGQCLEHCSRPWLTAQQIMRHCKPDGWIAVIAPFVQKRHGFPHDYFRFLDSGLIELFCDGVTVIESGVTQGTGRITDAWALMRKTLTALLPDTITP
jgi:SAM-dependent methyltransferase